MAGPGVGSQAILDILSKPRWARGVRGELLFLEDKSKRAGWSSRRRQYAADARQLPLSPTPTYVHPSSTPIARGYLREDDGDLTPVELMWLQRLPLDPEQVTHDDAARLAGLARSINAMKFPTSQRLVESIWAPVRELHDLRLAEQELEMARDALPQVPSSAIGAVAEALDEEHPEWRTARDNPDAPTVAASANASDLVHEVIHKRDEQHASTLAAAEERVRTLKQQAADRVALTRSTAE